jgi:hypothetical protein
MAVNLPGDAEILVGDKFTKDLGQALPIAEAF